MKLVLPVPAGLGALGAGATRGPTEEERLMYASHRHLCTAERLRLLALQTRASSLAVKLERDSLQGAVNEACGNSSAFTLFWAAVVMDANAKTGKLPWADDYTNLQGDAWLAMVLSVAGKILIPLAVLIGSPFNMPSTACPEAFTGKSFEVSLSSISYRVGVFMVCQVALWVNYQTIEQNECAFSFLQEFCCEDFCAEKENPDENAVEGVDVGLKKKNGPGELLRIFHEVNLLSFKLVLIASILLFYSQNTIVDIVLNSLALQFILQIENTVVSLVKFKRTIQKEFSSWFDDFDWYDDRVTAYLERCLEEKSMHSLFPSSRRRASIWTSVCHVSRFPCLRFDSKNLVYLDREWLDSHWFIKLSSLTDFTLLPTMVYFLTCVTFCVHPTFD
ncbi:hypothetical protein M885DRAFT_624849 [Pelagophyceae sp. CCMP2097]|nr:hypothetical protein M885DRAFT_624849 [Pelagophyceae sp. CCMP2097]